MSLFCKFFRRFPAQTSLCRYFLLPNNRFWQTRKMEMGSGFFSIPASLRILDHKTRRGLQNISKVFAKSNTHKTENILWPANSSRNSQRKEIALDSSLNAVCISTTSRLAGFAIERKEKTRIVNLDFYRLSNSSLKGQPCFCDPWRRKRGRYVACVENEENQRTRSQFPFFFISGHYSRCKLRGRVAQDKMHK